MFQTDFENTSNTELLKTWQHLTNAKDLSPKEKVMVKILNVELERRAKIHNINEAAKRKREKLYGSLGNLEKTE